MKKIAFFAVLIFLTSACNNQPNVNNPTNWLRGELVPVVSPFNENDTVLAMKVKYNFHSDYNGKTFYILKNNNSKAIQNKLFSILDDEGNRLDSLEICRCDRKSGCDGRTFIILYPRKTLSDLSPEVLKCEEVLDRVDEPDKPIYVQRCKLRFEEGILIFDYEMEIHEGQIYDNVLEKGDTIHVFEMGENTYFDDPFNPI